MHHLVIGAGQIGQALVHQLTSAGHRVTVLRRSDTPVAGVDGGQVHTLSGDALDPDLVRRAATGVDAVHHCLHAPYSAAAWRRELPAREQVVMDVAARLDIPVVFPESVYAFGLGARDLRETSPIAPVSPLGRVRADLLAARAEHRARTVSVVASDVVGPTATAGGSVILSTVLTPAGDGRRAWVLGDPDAPHAVTFLPDLARGMVLAAALARTGGQVLLAPTAAARSQREMARDAAAAAQQPAARVSSIPSAAFLAVAPFSATTRQLFHQRYLWATASVLRPGALETRHSLTATPWADVIDDWAAGRSATPQARFLGDSRP